MEDIRKDIKVYPVIGGIYRHYKGGLYEVITMASHSETQEPLVIYKSIHFGSVYARPLDMWFDDIILSDKKIDKMNPVSRFKLEK